MSKKPNKMNWERNLPLSEDKSFINSIHNFVPDDFEYYVPGWLEKYIDAQKVAEIGWDPPLAFKECCCRLLNFWRVEFATLANNGEPKKSYKPEVAQKINERKGIRLTSKKHAAETLMLVAGMRLKPTFDRLDKNSKPKFEYSYHPDTNPDPNAIPPVERSAMTDD